ncbi:LOW QUALITY PROTEIN: skin secretory protein xP2-like [Coturnix japonica]|uniref:LOW QUALITY PROTEIN: skin secretory protein xP2-like n=1 Tax=Coturnix japonica TaxID=93934 RepID=UPI0013A5D5F2|nr:LOW QUALITY PROTEIN: skin secretory protein xP2-like [Coturnix japonica]
MRCGNKAPPQAAGPGEGAGTGEQIPQSPARPRAPAAAPGQISKVSGGKQDTRAGRREAKKRPRRIRAPQPSRGAGPLGRERSMAQSSGRAALLAPCPSPEFSPVCKKLRASPELPAPRSAQAPLGSPVCRAAAGTAPGSEQPAPAVAGRGWEPGRRGGRAAPRNRQTGPGVPSLPVFNFTIRRQSSERALSERKDFPSVAVKTQRGGAVL